MWDKAIAWFIIFLGLNFLAKNFGLPNVDLGDVFKLWPLALIWVGWSMLRDHREEKRWEEEARTPPPAARDKIEPEDLQ